MRRLMRAAGPCGLRPERRRSPYEALIRAIAHQQLTGKAAGTILGRFFALYGQGRYPAPDELLVTPDELLRATGFSRAKVASLKDVAARTLDGTIPPRRALARQADAAIIERVTAAGLRIGSTGCRGQASWPRSGSAGRRIDPPRRGTCGARSTCTASSAR